MSTEEAFSQGDTMRRLHKLERQMQRMMAARTLEAAAVGQGGLRIHNGGEFLVEGIDGIDVMHVTADPPGIDMRRELIDDIAPEILGSRVHAQQRGASIPITSQTYTTVDDGLAISGIEVTFGVLIVAVTAALNPPGVDGAGIAAAFMGWDVAQDGGGFEWGPEDADALKLQHDVNALIGPDLHVIGGEATMTRLRPLFLAPGTYTLTPQYRVQTSGSTGTQGNFAQRSLVAIAL